MTEYEISYIPHAHTGQPVAVRRPIRRKDPSMVTIDMPELCARFTCIALDLRLEGLDEYHTKHPELPRQDDVRAIYQEARDILRKAGVNP